MCGEGCEGRSPGMAGRVVAARQRAPVEERPDGGGGLPVRGRLGDWRDLGLARVWQVDQF